MQLLNAKNLKNNFLDNEMLKTQHCFCTGTGIITLGETLTFSYSEHFVAFSIVAISRLLSNTANACLSDISDIPVFMELKKDLEDVRNVKI